MSDIKYSCLFILQRNSVAVHSKDIYNYYTMISSYCTRDLNLVALIIMIVVGQ